MDSSAAPADLLFDNGPVFAADGAAAPVRQAVAVRGGRIAAVGAEAREPAGPGTERVDLGGRLLVPGFQDSHIHAVFGGVELGHCEVSALGSSDAYVAAVAEYARRLLPELTRNEFAARVNHADATGRIVPGLLADLAVLDRDPFAGPAEAIHETRVLAAYVGGEAGYHA